VTEPIKLIKKVVLLGDGAVGKTCLIRKYVYDIFDDKYIVTLGAKATKKVLTITPKDGSEPVELKLLIYDILGQKHHMELTEMYYRGAEGALLVTDLTRKQTLDDIGSWVSSLEKVVGKVPVVFLANKMDLTDQAQFGGDELSQAAEGYGSASFLTSAKTGENVESAFEALGSAIVERFLAQQAEK